MKTVVQFCDLPCSPSWQAWCERLMHEGSIGLGSEEGDGPETYRWKRVSLETVLSWPVAERESVVGILCTITHRLDATVLSQFPQLAIVASYGVGVNHIDLAEAQKRGVVVTNTPGILGKTVADLTWGLILSVCRRVVESDRSVRSGAYGREVSGGWRPDYQLGMEVTGKTLGIIGLGDIGQYVAQRAHGFEMTVLYYQRHPLSQAEEERHGVYYRSFEALLEESDMVSIHTPLTPETRHLFNAGTLKRMKSQSVLINTSRGPVVDEDALVEALQSGHLYGAGLDVFESEPVVHPALLTMENVVLTAHIGSATAQTRQRMGDCALENLQRVLQGKPPLTAV